MRIVRRIFWSVMAALFIPFLIGVQTRTDSIAFPMFLAMVGWWFFGGLPSRLIGVASIGTLRCKHCGFEIPAVDRWQIGQYTDHRVRHILLAKSPINGARVSHTNCPQCGSSILV